LSHDRNRFTTRCRVIVSSWVLSTTMG
jgi:hypothetical protein